MQVRFTLGLATLSLLSACQTAPPAAPAAPAAAAAPPAWQQAAQLGLRIFQGEVTVATAGPRKAGQLSGDAHRVETCIQRVRQGTAQGRHRPYPPGRQRRLKHGHTQGSGTRQRTGVRSKSLN